MPGRIGQHEFWTAYRCHLVRVALARGDDRRLIAERLGVTLRTLSTAIHRLGLHLPEQVNV